MSRRVPWLCSAGLALMACKGEPTPPAATPTPDVYEVPEGWPTEGDPWATFTARAGCTQTGDNGDVYTYDEYGWPLTGTAGDASWSSQWEYTRVDEAVTDSEETATFGSATFISEFTHDANQVVLTERYDGSLVSECRHTYEEGFGLTRTTRCQDPDASDPVVSEHDWCGQARWVDRPGDLPVEPEVTYSSGCILASVVDPVDSGVTTTRVYDAEGREVEYTFDNGQAETITYTWACD